MGQFSWMDCKNEHRAILDDVATTSYVLVPEEFREQYGKHIKESCYDGYGRFGGYDVYELVAIWNRDHIGIENLKKPRREQWRPEDEKYFDMAMDRYANKCHLIKDFTENHLSDKEMKEKYGSDWLRELGIDIACYDEQNAALEYPIKITHDRKVVYEDCEPSKGDPNQGWGYYCKMYDSDIEFLEYEELKNAYDQTEDDIILEYIRDNYDEEYRRDFPDEEHEEEYE